MNVNLKYFWLLNLIELNMVCTPYGKVLDTHHMSNVAVGCIEFELCLKIILIYI